MKPSFRLPLRLAKFLPSLRALVVMVLGASAAQAGPVTVFAAASLKDSLEEIATGFAETRSEAPVFSFAGSSVLARQISLGAPADIFISANTEWMDVLEASGAIQVDSRGDLLGNSLVLIAGDPAVPQVAMSETLDLAGMLGGGRLAMGLLEAVPAGIYGKQALAYFGLWESVAAQVAQSDNVRATLALVSSGEAPFGIVYATDAMADPRVTVVARFPEDSHDPIRYPAALTSQGTSPQAAAFLAYLRSPAAVAVFERHGFVVIAE